MPNPAAVGPFVYTGLPSRVVFGFGTLATLAEEIQRLNCSRAFLLSTAGHRPQVKRLAERLGNLAAGIFTEAAMHTPTEVTDRALVAFREAGGDCTVALGGGSCIGLGKALALRTDMPQIVIPTTYAGSEATPVVGETRNGVKTTQRSLAVLPEIILYDVELTLSLSPFISAASGLNAIAHAVEGLYARDANPLTSTLAVDGIKALAAALPVIVKDPFFTSRHALAALYGSAWLCGDLSRYGRYEPASQTLPHARWQLQSAARANACGPAGICSRLQRGSRTGRYDTNQRGFGERRCGRRTV